MFLKPHRPVVIPKKSLCDYVKNSLTSQNSELPPEFRLILDHNRNITIRLIWIVVLSLCFSISVYQTYDRVRYYQEKPISVNIFAEEKEYTDVKPFLVTNLDTDAMAEYWSRTPTDESTQNLVTCGCPMRGLLTQMNFTLTNATKLWAATNTTPVTESIQLIYGRKDETMFLDDGIIVNSSADGIFNVRDVNTVYGKAVVISRAPLVKIGSRLVVTLREKGGCPGLQMPTILMLNPMPFRYVTFSRFGTTVRFSNSITQFNFINSVKSPCESDPKKEQQCLHRCLLKRYSDLPCRFPFMPVDSKPTECNSSMNTSLIEVYEEARKIYSFTSATIHCNCTRPCAQETLKTNPVKEKIANLDISVIEYLFNEQYVLVFREKYAYDGIALLIDIGGNMGLFLGLSLVSITQLGQLGLVYLFKMMKDQFSGTYMKRRKLNGRVTKKIDKQLMKIQEGQKDSLPFLKYSLSGIATKIIVAFLIAISIYMTHERIVHYLSVPTRSVVVITEDKLLYHPNLIVCGEGGAFIFKKSLLAKKNKIPECDVHFLDFIDLKKMPVQEVWNDTIIYEDGLVLTALLALTGKNDDVPVYNHSYIYMPDGLCHEYTFEQLPFGGVGSGYAFCFTEVKSKCKDGLIQIYQRPLGAKIHSILSSERKISPNFRVSIAVRTLKLQRVNYPAKPCETRNIFEKCSNDCYESKIKATVTCRLPFMENINQSWCNTTASAKESLLAYRKIAMRTDVQRECNCLPPCKEVIYQTYVYFDEPDLKVNFVGNYPQSSLVENIIEVPSYSIVALLCDVGNSFGLTLGLSLLAILYGIEPAGKVMLKCFNQGAVKKQNF